MLVSYNWLKELVDVFVPSSELAEVMSTSGIEVEGVTRPNESLKKLVVGFVKECIPHPDSDHLSICTVDVGASEDLTIVCGAANVKQGIKVIVALVGARIAGNYKIKKGKIRGVESLGMICSLAEIGFSDSVIPKAFVDGIYYLPDDAEIGASIDRYLGLDDEIIELSITPNRADALSMRGVAYEVAAIYGQTPHFDVKPVRESQESAKDRLSVAIDDISDAKTYQMRLIEGVEVKPSPLWLQNRLMAEGIRPINNVVDVTNLVLLYFGQPLHSFDFDKFTGDVIRVRRAKDGEELVTLDGERRALSVDDLVITNDDKPVALAGVMGGLSTEIDDNSITVALEAALFNPQLIRKTSQKFNLRSESSARFEKGINQATVNEALDYAAALIADLGGGIVLKDTVNSGEFKAASVTVGTTIAKINRSLGTKLSLDEVISIFERLGFGVETIGEDILVNVAPRRWDITIEADLVEEVARLYGYDKLPETLPVGQTLIGELTPKQRLTRRSRKLLEGAGLSETISYALLPPDKAALFTLEPTQTTALNFPMSLERSVLRQSIVTEMLTNVSYNQARKNKNVAFYEIGKIFEQHADTISTLPTERTHVAIALSGNRLEKDFQTVSVAYDFADLKGIVELYFQALNLVVTFEKLSSIKELHPGRAAKICLDNTVIGFLGQVHPEVAKAFEITETYVAEFDLEIIVEAKKEQIFSEISKFQPVVRDIAFLVNQEVTHADVLAVIEEARVKLLKGIQLFDIYQGKNLPSDKKSMAYSLSFASREKTLTDEEVNHAVAKITRNLAEKLNAKIR
ncbi:MAG: phenylalanine--tRNA ligase subunit beta [Streptococcaceae bacterium]|jgi:phenylalanyl-tRNA synthetase beta chain|nr:phenylalanine--tRNA ligase subunit beta [Streptococcaceae bacterium]